MTLIKDEVTLFFSLRPDRVEDESPQKYPVARRASRYEDEEERPVRRRKPRYEDEDEYPRRRNRDDDQVDIEKAS